MVSSPFFLDDTGKKHLVNALAVGGNAYACLSVGVYLVTAFSRSCELIPVCGENGKCFTGGKFLDVQNLSSFIKYYLTFWAVSDTICI